MTTARTDGTPARIKQSLAHMSQHCNQPSTKKLQTCNQRSSRTRRAICLAATNLVQDIIKAKSVASRQPLVAIRLIDCSDLSSSIDMSATLSWQMTAGLFFGFLLVSSVAMIFFLELAVREQGVPVVVCLAHFFDKTLQAPHLYSAIEQSVMDFANDAVRLVENLLLTFGSD